MSGEKTVSEEAIPLAAPSEDDVNTTPPNPPAKDTTTGWSMPEPVFRKTSGYLPQGYADKFDQTPVPSGDSESTAEMPAPGIGPQPDIDSSESPNLPTAAVRTAPTKSSTAKVVFMVVGVIFALALIAVFIAVVYFLFLMPKPEGTI